jgi:hypothetical protein
VAPGLDLSAAVAGGAAGLGLVLGVLQLLDRALRLAQLPVPDHSGDAAALTAPSPLPQLDPVLLILAVGGPAAWAAPGLGQSDQAEIDEARCHHDPQQGATDAGCG